MEKEFPDIQWVRYADDGALNCVTEKQAKYMIKILENRFRKFGLELNLSKTKIVYCKDSRRKDQYENITFDFLGYTFRPRGVKAKNGEIFTGFNPAISEKAKKRIRKTVKSWKLQLKVDKTIKEIAESINKQIQGWINYYTHYYKSEIYDVIRYIHRCLIKWVRRKYKKINSVRRANKFILEIAENQPDLFAHWKLGKIG